MIYVTHDQVEAMTLADRIVVLRSGLVEQVGSPQDLYDRPANTFVAGFIGSPKMNFLEARVERRDGALLHLVHPGLATPLKVETREAGGTTGPGDGVVLGLRPEHLTFDAGENRLALKADLSESLGGSTLIYGQTTSGETVTLQTAGRKILRKGESFSAGFEAAHAYLFDKAGQAL